MADLAEIKTQVIHLKSAAFSREDGLGTYRASAHEKALCDLVVKLIEALEGLAIHQHNNLSAFSNVTGPPLDPR